MSNQIITQDVLDHCQQYLGCEGCPLKGGCDNHGPVTQKWLDDRVAAIRTLISAEVESSARYE